jgi:hypothetical protein
MPKHDYGHSRIKVNGRLRPVRTLTPKPEYLGGPMDEDSNVEPWVQKIVEQELGGPPVEIGKVYQHPLDGKIEIVAGRYWGQRRTVESLVVACRENRRNQIRLRRAVARGQQ